MRRDRQHKQKWYRYLRHCHIKQVTNTSTLLLSCKEVFFTYIASLSY